jgi:hypothetical protein
MNILAIMKADNSIKEEECNVSPRFFNKGSTYTTKQQYFYNCLTKKYKNLW